MRTTLTIDDDLAGILQQRSSALGKSFKEVLNHAIRRGLMEEGMGQKDKVVTRPAALGLREGLNPDKMNQLYDEIEVLDYLQKSQRP